MARSERVQLAGVCSTTITSPGLIASPDDWDQSDAADRERGRQDCAIRVFAEHGRVGRVRHQVDTARMGECLHEVEFRVRRISECTGLRDEPHDGKRVRFPSLDLDRLTALQRHVCLWHAEPAHWENERLALLFARAANRDRACTGDVVGLRPRNAT